VHKRPLVDLPSPAHEIYADSSTFVLVLALKHVLWNVSKKKSPRAPHRAARGYAYTGYRFYPIDAPPLQSALLASAKKLSNTAGIEQYPNTPHRGRLHLLAEAQRNEKKSRRQTQCFKPSIASTRSTSL